MITENFKRVLRSIQLDNTQIDMIEKYLQKDKARINADVVEYGDGSQYYSQEYIELMMLREYQRGKHDGTREPVIHRAETVISPCLKCGYTEWDIL